MRPSLLTIGLIALVTTAYSVAIENSTCPHLPYVPLNIQQCPPIHNAHGDHAKLLDPDTFDALFLNDAVLPQLQNDPRFEAVEATRSQRSSLQINGSSTLSKIARTDSPTPSSRPLIATDTPITPQESRSGKLLSFEEWKKQVVQQEGEDTVKRRKITPPVKKSIPRQQIDSIDGAFGDDVGSMFDNSDDAPQQHHPLQQFPPPFASKQEALDFANEQRYSDGQPLKDPLVAAPPWSQQQQQHVPQKQKFFPTTDTAPRKTAKKDKESINPLKKLKELYNYASIDCAATVLKANKEAKNPQSILYESKDQYMLNRCSADKFVIVDLCESILIDKFVLANFEFFSSTFKDFRVYVADRYPPKEWRLLGQWQAKNTRDLQIFKVETGLDWYQYIKIEFLSHYGNEYYCPLSLLRVHGNPMMEYWTLYEKPKITGEDEEDDMLKGISPDPVVDETEFLWPAFSSVDIGTKSDIPSLPTVEDMLIAEREAKSLKLDALAEQSNTNTATDKSTSTDSSHHSQSHSLDEMAGTIAENLPQDLPPSNQAVSDEPRSSHNANQPSVESQSATESMASTESDLESTGNVSSVSDGKAISGSSVPSSGSLSPEIQDQKTTEAGSSDDVQQEAITEHSTPPSPTEEASATPIASEFNFQATTTPAGASNQGKTPFGYGQGANMESIYKTIMTRILNLEQNATLSQRYLDDQNRMLNEVFETMEQKHREQLLQLVGQLNSTASLRIDTMKRRYERLYRMTARELEMTKNETAKELQELSHKLHIMADQVVFEKRLSLIQLILLISLFLFTAANKGTLSTLSPIVAAQAQERQRRQSVSHHQSTASQTDKTEERPAIARQASSQTPQLTVSQSSDATHQAKGHDKPALSEAKREIQISKSSVENLKLKPTRQSTAELLSRTAEFDPIKHERWNHGDDIGKVRKSETAEPAIKANDEYYDDHHDTMKKKSDKLSSHPDTPLFSESPAMISEVWPSPCVEDQPIPPSAVQDHHHLDGDLRLSRASSFVDRLDLSYMDSPKAHAAPRDWWKEPRSNENDSICNGDNELEVEKSDHTDHHTLPTIDGSVPSVSQSQDTVVAKAHSASSEEDEEARVPDIEGDR